MKTLETSATGSLLTESNIKIVRVESTLTPEFHLNSLQPPEIVLGG